MFGIFKWKKVTAAPSRLHSVPSDDGSQLLQGAPAAGGALRPVMADAENERGAFLVKKVSRLTATYQIRLLAYKCTKEKKQLVLMVPAECIFESSLVQLMTVCPAILREELR